MARVEDFTTAAYGERGIGGKIPPGAMTIAEIEFIAERDMGSAQ
jgi:hypothetical protein